MVVSMTVAKLKPLIISVSGFAICDVANICISVSFDPPCRVSGQTHREHGFPTFFNYFHADSSFAAAQQSHCYIYSFRTHSVRLSGAKSQLAPTVRKLKEGIVMFVGRTDSGFILNRLRKSTETLSRGSPCISRSQDWSVHDTEQRQSVYQL
jgi:hypothetical protein